MGKVRVNTIGDEAAEKKQKDAAEKRQEAKKAKKASVVTEEEISTQDTPKKKMVKKQGKAKIRSKRYTAATTVVDTTKVYALSEALDLLAKMEKAKFDETVELHFNTTDKVNVNVILPNGTGKQTRVAILAPSKDATGADALLKQIEAGKIEFDVLIATPDAMPRLAKVARVLGPKGLMPNPKNGTVTPKPEEVAKNYAGGQVNIKTEPKANVLHVSVGKLSFGKEKLSANIQAMLGALDTTKLKNAYLKSTMSPSLRLVIK